MSLAVDLMGVGLPQEQATRLGYSALTTIAGVGTAQSGAAAIPNFVNAVLATTAGGQTALRLPSDAELNVPYLVVNSSATAALVFPPSGGAINAASGDASVSISQNLGRIFIRLTSTRWISFLTA
jgi:hypothetical protein